MRKHALLIAFAAIAGCLVLLSQGTSAQNANTKSLSGKWEYKVVHVSELIGGAKDVDGIVNGLQNNLNDLGDDGWELSLEVNGGVVLKRPK